MVGVDDVVHDGSADSPDVRDGEAELALPLSRAELGSLQEAVIGWFAAEGRDLPWRRTRDPWSVLIAEMMLQQIQVARAVPYYEAFVGRFPTPAALAGAPLAEAIRVWADLGRYRALVSLHRAARIIVDEHGGAVPSEPAVLRSLPGVGPYTAGAVACFAFERDEAFLDTNLRRVVHRLFVGVDLPRPSAGDRLLLSLAAGAIPAGRAWHWTQGLMDLGATRCTARRPRCEGCPVRAWCRAAPEMPAAVAELAASPPKRRREAETAPAYRYDDFQRDRCRPATGEGVARRASGHRFYRGRVLAALRELPAGADGLDVGDLGTRLRPGFDESELPWLRGVVESLAKDGLAVAEERPAYDAGQTTLRVRLPE